jgi:hypothetical protein
MLDLYFNKIILMALMAKYRGESSKMGKPL